MFFGFYRTFLMFFRLPSYLSTKRRFAGLAFASVVVLFPLVCTPSAASADDTGPASLQPAAFNYTGTYSLRETDPNLTGKGVAIAAVCRSLTYLDGQPQNDYRLNTEHKCFLDSNVSFVDGLSLKPGISEHSTAIGGILVGHDLNASHPQVGTFQYEGAVPEAQLDVYEFWRFLVNYVFGPKELKADILTMSVGTAFEDWWTRGIERMVQANGLIVLAGVGNGGDVFDPILYPAAGSNVIGVGVIDSVTGSDPSKGLSDFSLPHAEHSSAGPTSDGRCKPDIVAPGNCLVPDANSTSRYDVTGDWSSFATPVVAGTVGLLVQKANSEPDLNSAVSSEAGNCVMKAILMNSATKLPYWHKGSADKADDHRVSLDYVQGAGMLNAQGAYEQLIAGRGQTGDVQQIGWDNDVIEESENARNVYRIEIPKAKDKIITATLVWNMHYEDEYPFKALTQADNDLRLELWAVDTNDPNEGYLIDYSDSISDNVEHIYCPTDPNYNNYVIVVTFSAVSDSNDTDAKERYGLAWNTNDADKTESIYWYDLNGDGKVNSLDFAILLKNLNKTAESEEGYLLGDINMDGVIDIKDVVILMGHLTPRT
jgi:hypothetical protein